MTFEIEAVSANDEKSKLDLLGPLKCHGHYGIKVFMHKNETTA